MYATVANINKNALHKHSLFSITHSVENVCLVYLEPLLRPCSSKSSIHPVPAAVFLLLFYICIYPIELHFNLIALPHPSFRNPPYTNRTVVQYGPGYFCSHFSGKDLFMKIYCWRFHTQEKIVHRRTYIVIFSSKHPPLSQLIYLSD